MHKIKKNDEVVILTGKDKGKRGKVLFVSPKEQRVVVEGINMVKKHIKPSQQSQGGIINREASIHISNVGLFNPATQKAGKVGFKILEDGRKVRYFKANQALVEASA